MGSSDLHNVNSGHHLTLPSHSPGDLTVQRTGERGGERGEVKGFNCSQLFSSTPGLVAELANNECLISRLLVVLMLFESWVFATSSVSITFNLS